jgi:hypothetical protein
MFLSGYSARLREFLPLHAGRVLPGVRALLDDLAARDNVALGLW